MALFTMAFFGMMPVSALIAGGIAHVASVHVVFIVAGIGAVIAGLAFRRELPQLRVAAHPVLA